MLPRIVVVYPGSSAATIQGAIDRASLGGGIVLFLASEYELGSQTLALHSGVEMLADGAVTLVNSTGFTLVDASDSTGCTVSNIGFRFDGAGLPNFRTALQFDRSDQTLVTGCRFSMQPSTPGSTQHAVLARGASGITVQNCTVRHMQLKLGGPSGGPKHSVGIKALNNDFFEPYNYAVSVVSNNAADSFDNVVVAGNRVVGVPSVGAFTVGSDGGANDIAALTNVSIENNTVSGAWVTENTPHAILVHPGVTTDNLQIVGNRISNNGSTQASGPAVVLDEKSGTTLTNIAIENNRVVGDFDHESIRVNVGEGGVVRGNHFHGARGLKVIGTTGVLVEGNIGNSTSHGIVVVATKATVQDNAIETSASNKYAATFEGTTLTERSNRLSSVSHGADWEITDA